ncbi:MAG: nucleotidyltransferase domain-containing protein [Nanoarchaeota archaeon]|nr:nucleotidyltransferase domain-containing protein [Nanoarchaeota archaeon]
MELKDYRLEIVNALLKGEGHVRGLASKIGVNHMTVLRKIKILFRENVVDYNEEGKNKVYFIKKNPEAKYYTFMAEYYKLIQTLKKYPYLRKVIEKIQKDKNIELAILFGSHAKHEAKKDSDVDIYIETKDKKIKQDLERIDSKLSIKIGAYDRKNLLIKEIEKNHIIIKGVEEFYEKNEFFG